MAAFWAFSVLLLMVWVQIAAYSHGHREMLTQGAGTDVKKRRQCMLPRDLRLATLMEQHAPDVDWKPVESQRRAGNAGAVSILGLVELAKGHTVDDVVCVVLGRGIALEILLQAGRRVLNSHTQ